MVSNLAFLETFATVVEKGSFTAAGDALGLSKPVVSKQIAQLESDLGVRLLNRTTRRLHLTEAGEIFYDHCQRVVAQARDARLAVAPLQHEPRGTLRVTSPQCLAISLLPNLIPRFQERFPAVHLDIRVSGRFVDLIEEGIDVALRIGELEDSSLIARRLAPCAFVVCASPDYWRKHGKPQRPGDLASHNCLVYTESPKPNHWQFRERTGEDLRITVKGNLRSDDAALLLSAACAHRGVLVGPSFMFGDAIAQGRLEPVLEDFHRPSMGLYVVYPQSRHLSSKARVFVDYLFENAAEHIAPGCGDEAGRPAPATADRK
jgi:DNA-binding transcriptional LysR family regulator